MPLPQTPLRTRLLALAAATALAACSVNPATGDRQFTGLLPQSQEAALGAGEHPKVLARFGGAYRNPGVSALVERIGARLAAASERPEGPWTFTVLDSDVVNAFALPGGYVYVTRGLVALAADEAEVAGVLAHEMAHVTARHTAERVSRSTLTGLLATGLGAALGSPAVAQALGIGGEAVLAGYSRGQELEADELGIRYLAAAGYDPGAMASFLETMRRNEQYEALRAGSGESGFGFFATHPETGDRVERAAERARAAPGVAGARPVAPYLDAVDGMIWGDSPEHGFVRGQEFAHPALGFRFAVPDGFSLLNGDAQVIARGPEGAAVVFDAAPGGGDVTDHLTRSWAPGAALEGVEALTIGGLPAATGVTRGRTGEGPVDVRLLAIDCGSDMICRFAFAAPSGALPRFDPAFRATADGFRRLSPAEAARYRPRRVRVVTVGPHHTVERLAARMPQMPFAEELFRIINDLPPGTSLAPGERIKIVSES